MVVPTHIRWGVGERWDSLLGIGRHADWLSIENVLDGFMSQRTFARNEHVADAEASTFIGNADERRGSYPAWKCIVQSFFFSLVSFSSVFLLVGGECCGCADRVCTVQYSTSMFCTVCPVHTYSKYLMLHERSPVDG